MRESEAQKALINWFRSQGYTVETNVGSVAGNKIDIIATKGKKKWIVEVKGDYDKNTAQYNVNFDTAIGQIVKSVTQIKDNILYGICIPFSRTERMEKLSYRLILPKYEKTQVFKRLNIYLMLVRDDKSVQVVDSKNVNNFIHQFLTD